MSVARKIPSILAAATPLLAGGAHAEDAMQAVWKTQEIQFNYHGFTSTYTCDGLRDRVRAILRQLGADADLQVSTAGCGPTDRPTPLPSLRIVLSTPVPATPENIAEIAKHADDKALVRRSTGKRASGSETADQFPAIWRTVDFRKSDLRAESGECELMEELRDQVFNKLSLRIIDDHLTCVPHQLSPGQPDLTVTALVQAPSADSGVRKQ